MSPSTAAAPGHQARPADGSCQPPVLDVVIPVHDEEADLPGCVRRVHAHLSASMPYPFRITVVDNASTDATLALALALSAELPEVGVVHTGRAGRGGALRAGWSSSQADVLVYMDVDLSTDLRALLPLVAPLVSGHSDLAIGTRLSRSSYVVRAPGREVVSRCYNLLLRGSLRVRFSDAQCGFKAIRRDVAEQLLPLVVDTGWFFDTELLVLAERAGLRIAEVPVDWVDDPDSSVHVLATAWADAKGVARLGRDLWCGSIPLEAVRTSLAHRPHPAAPANLLGQVLRFGAVGLASTLAYAALFLALRTPLGPQAANLAALLATTVMNTAGNRRLTFGVRGTAGAARHHGQGLVVLALCWALTAGSLAGLHLLAPGSRHAGELVVLTVANLLATVVRFTLLRRWVFRPPSAPPTAVPPPARAEPAVSAAS